MSYANRSDKSEIDGNECIVNNTQNINNPRSGSNKAIETLHDPLIAEKSRAVADKIGVNDEDVNKTAKTDPNQLKENTMFFYCGWQLFCLLLVIFSVYGTYQNILPHDIKYPKPQRMFSVDSFVKDYPRGNLFTVQTKVTLSDLSFVMFYAPWSAESQHSRSVYEAAAQLFHKEATFSAINCWQPDGECRQQYKKVMSWPVLMAYSQNNIAIPYNGQWTETALTRFIHLLLKPLKRVSRPEELLELIHNHDAVAVLFVDMNKSASFYNIFYQFSLKWLENDPYGDLAFAVVTGESMSTFGVEHDPSLRLYLWNETIEYDNTLWKPSLLHNWMMAKTQKVTYWLSPPGTRSKVFEAFVRRGPVLILFTPRNLYEFSNDAYAMLRQAGYEYHNCLQDDWLKEMSRNYMRTQRTINYNERHLKTEECEQIFNWKNSVQDKCAPFNKGTFIGLVNSSKFHYNTAEENQQSTEYCLKHAKNEFDESAIPNKCTSNSRNEFSTSELDVDNDLRSSKNILNIWKAIDCKLNRLSKKIQAKTFYDEKLEKPKNNSESDIFNKIIGLACKTNKTLSFLAMDSFTYGLVAEKLGISLRSGVHHTTAVIIDSKDESSYVLNGAVTSSSLVNFIYDFTMNKLTRHLRSDRNTNHSHYYNSVNSQNSRNYHPNVDSRTSGNKIGSVELKKISSVNFTEFIWESNKTTAVLFSSTQCAFCTIFSSILLTISRIFPDESYLRFARIDNDKNDLPWQFSMESVPTLIVFNGDNKSDSRKFPSSMKVTVQNVLGFILSNLNRPNRLRAMAAIVRYKSQQKSSIEVTLLVLRREIEQNIVENLRLWRKMSLKRAYILRRIQALRHLYFSLHRPLKNSDLDNFNELIQNVLNVWLYDDTFQ